MHCEQHCCEHYPKKSQYHGKLWLDWLRVQQDIGTVHSHSAPLKLYKQKMISSPWCLVLVIAQVPLFPQNFSKWPVLKSLTQSHCDFHLLHRNIFQNTYGWIGQNDYTPEWPIHLILLLLCSICSYFDSNAGENYWKYYQRCGCQVFFKILTVLDACKLVTTYL